MFAWAWLVSDKLYTRKTWLKPSSEFGLVAVVFALLCWRAEMGVHQERRGLVQQLRKIAKRYDVARASDTAGKDV